MGDFNATSFETMESTEMERIFPSLLKKGYLTEMEFQKIIRMEKLLDRRLEIYNLLMVKDKSTADEIYNIFRRMTTRVSAKENNSNHALLNAVVSDRIFAFLPMNDVLNCRLVCQQWEAASSNTLRKRVTINFKREQGPSKFLEVFKNSSVDIRLQYFEFWDNRENGWEVSEIEEFFDKWGTNIKKLKFQAYRLIQINKDHWFRSYDITHWISKACNLTKINVDSSASSDETEIKIQLSKISSVKFITLKRCIISIDDAVNENIQIQPVEITLDDVTFQRKGSIQKKLRLNDLIDFSQATKINLHFAYTESKFELDMKSQMLNVKSLHLDNLKLTNLSAASGKVNFFSLRSSNFGERSRLQIDQLFCENSTVDLCALPKTIEKLYFSYLMNYICRDAIDLPQLRFLQLDNEEEYPLISHFNRCYNLVEIELNGGCSWFREAVNLNVHLVPKSVKRMKLETNIIITNPNAGDNDGQEIRGENCILNLDTLILEDYLHRMSSEVSQMMSVIKPKVLVVSCCDNTDEDRVIDTTSICDFLLANKQLHKLIVGCTVYDLHRKTPFELSVFARFVGRKKANYYEFENCHEMSNEFEDPVGAPISWEEFDLYRTMNGL